MPTQSRGHGTHRSSTSAGAFPGAPGLNRDRYHILLNMPNPIEPPLLTAGLDGVGGTIKQQVEDFEVEEIPAYEPSGEGDHLFLWIEKRSMGAEYFTRQIARRLNLAA